ncbi:MULTISPECIES: lipopolysaccharide biosynthesis protein [Bradyrhizobium]|uniref:lipopolysaccharide biosynthesis protein n=1 Tax=Bradyrhizobium TaxID=374 RepID=UPI00293ED558|nr:lipopolysaccharide biosynthesis protein [Bradyrhizobium sp. BWC-3-1]WOH57324.1 lipopolysaccharide biosynthesis protein [Bradyrhizobium sp. BWC-3-1]
MDHNSKARAVKNIAITGTAQAWRIGTGLLLTIVTTRFLSPSDFGILAMVGTATALIALVKDLGISQAIVQREIISDNQVSSLFWVSVVVSIIFAALLAASAPVMASFYAEPRVEPLTLCFAVLTLLGGPQAVPSAILNRNSQFNQLAIVDIASSTVAFAVGLSGTLLWQNYWGLYASAASATIVSGVGIWVFSRYKPSAPHLDKNVSDMLRFGSHVSGFNIVNYFARNCDNILIGRFQGSEQLGTYDRAYRLLLFPISQIHGPIGQVLVPLLARLRTEPERYRSTYIEAVSLIMVVMQPGILYAVIFAHQLFDLLFGEKWTAAASIFQWLGIAGLHQVITSTVGWLFLSQGRGGDFFRIGVYSSVLTVGSFIVGLPWGAVGVASAYAISNTIIVAPLVWIHTGRRGPVSCPDLIRAAVPHALAVAVTAPILKFLQLSSSGLTIYQALGFAAISYLVHVGIVLLFPSKRDLLWRAIRLLKR